MSREIEEMAKIMCQDAGTKNCNVRCEAAGCDVFFFAEKLYKEGYRKKEIGVWEIGATIKDLAQAEGLPSNATKKEREAYHDFMSHIAHCSICVGMHDDRTIELGYFCKYCGAYMGGKINDKR